MAVESTGYPHTNTLRHEHAGGDGELGCLCGKAGTSHVCDDSTHSSGCVVNGYGCLMATKACSLTKCFAPTDAPPINENNKLHISMHP